VVINWKSEAYCASRASVVGQFSKYDVYILDSSEEKASRLTGTPAKSQLGIGRLGGANSDANEGFVWCGM
jgi:hypothetical protein